MTDSHERLQKARLAAGYKDATTAAHAFGWNENTYRSHENGERGITRAVGRYAAAFHVSKGWLLHGEGGVKVRNVVPIMGFMGLGEGIDILESDGKMPLEEIELPFGFSIEGCAALISRGNAYHPRVKNGEALIYTKEGKSAEAMLGAEAVVKVEGGPVLLKTIRRGSEVGRFNLESHNSPTMENEAIEWVGDVLSIIPSGKWRMIR